MIGTHLTLVLLVLFNIIISSCIHTVYAQAFQRTYGTAANLEAAHTILVDAAGSYVLAGVSNEGGNKDGVIIKVANDGSIIWQFRYDLGGEDEIVSILQATDNNYVVAGNTLIPGNENIFVMKVNANTGAPMWTRNIDFGAYDHLHFSNCLDQFGDGSLWVTGSTAIDNLPASRNTYIAKLGGNGVFFWGREVIVNPNNEDFGSSVTGMPDNRGIIVGKTTAGGGGADGTFIRMAANGTFQIARAFNFGANFDYLTSVERTPDNAYLMTGIHGQPNGNTLIMKTDELASSVGGFGPYRILVNGLEIGGRGFQTTDAGYLIPATTTIFNQKAILLHKLDALNTLEWTVGYGQATTNGVQGFDSAFVALPTPDGGYVVGAYSKGMGEGSGDMYLIKLDAQPVTLCQDTLFSPTLNDNTGFVAVPTIINVVPPLNNAPQINNTQATATALNLITNNPCCDKFKANFTAEFFCANDSTLFTPDTLFNNTIYEWDFNNDGVIDLANDGKAKHRFNVPGNYSVKLSIRNENTGCEHSYLLDIEVRPFPTFIQVSQNIELCIGDSAQLNVSTNVIDATYNWIPNTALSATNIPNPKTSPPIGNINYTVTATNPNNGCKNDSIINVIVHALPNVDAGPKTFICVNGTVTLQGSGAVEYFWAPVDSVTNSNIPNPNTTINTPQYLYLTGIDANGCVNRDSVYVAVAQVVAGNDTSFCQGVFSGVDISAHVPDVGGCTLVWEPINLQGDTVTVSPTTNTCYVVRATCNGCISTDTICVFVVAPLNMDAGPDVTICQGQATTLNATGGVLYEWSPETGLNQTTGQSVLASPVQTTIYKVKVTDATGCFGFDSVKVTVNDLPNLFISSDTTICVVDSVRLEASTTNNAVKYEWIPTLGIPAGAQFTPNPKVSPGLTVTYTVQITDTITNCIFTDTVRVTVKGRAVLIDAGPNKRFCSYYEGDTLRGVYVPNGNNYEFTWQPENSIVGTSTILRPYARPTVTTTYTLTATLDGCVSARDSVTLFITPQPIALMDTFQVKFCQGSGGVQLPGSVQSGTPPYYYEWLPNSGIDELNRPDPVANPDVTTTYKLVVTDAEGCISDTAWVTAWVYPVPIANAGPDKTICLGTGGGVYLEGSVANDNQSESYTVRWRPAYGLSDTTILNPYATPDTTTIYTLYLIGDKSGCRSEPTTLDSLATVVVNIRKTPIADAGPDSVFVCAGDAIQIGGTPYGAGPFYTFHWSPEIGLSNANTQFPIVKPFQTTTYYNQVFSGGCISHVDSIVVVVKPRPTVSLNKIFEICPKDSVKLKAVISEGFEPYTYQWQPSIGLSNPAEKEPFAKPAQTTTYSLTVFAKDCPSSGLDTARVEVFPAPIVVANPTQKELTLCLAEGDSIVLPAQLINPEGYTPYYLQWSPSTALSNPNILNPKVRPTETTIYYVQLKAAFCSNKDSVIVSVRPFVAASITGDTTEICKGDSVLLIGKGGVGAALFTWQWKDSLTNITYTIKDVDSLWVKPQSSTTYILKVEEDICKDADTFFVKVRVTPEPNIRNSAGIGCEGLTVRFDDNGSTDMFRIWDFGDGSSIVNQQSPVHTYAQPGTYTITLKVSSFEYCITEQIKEKQVVVGQESLANFGSIPAYPAELILPFAQVQFIDSSFNAITWHWQFGDGQASIERNPRHTYERTGLFDVTLTVIDSSGCTYSKTHGVYHVIEPQLQIPNIFTPNGDEVNDTWAPRYSGLEDFSVIVFDRWGIEVYRAHKNEADWRGTYPDGKEAATGVYYYIVDLKGKKIEGSVTLLR